MLYISSPICWMSRSSISSSVNFHPSTLSSFISIHCLPCVILPMLRNSSLTVCTSSLNCSMISLQQYAHTSPFVLSEWMASSSHFLALSNLLSFQNSLATEQLMEEFVPHCSIAMLAFFFRVLWPYLMIAIAQIYPDFGQSFSALAKVVLICLLFPCEISNLMRHKNNSSFLGFFIKALSITVLALPSKLWVSSIFIQSFHNFIDFECSFTAF